MTNCKEEWLQNNRGIITIPNRSILPFPLSICFVCNNYTLNASMFLLFWVIFTFHNSFITSKDARIKCLDCQWCFMHISDCWTTDYARQRTISEPVNINDEKFFVNFLIIVLMIIVYNGNSIDVESRIDLINEFLLKIYLLHTN